MTIFHVIKYGHINSLDIDQIPKSIQCKLSDWHKTTGMEIYISEGVGMYIRKRHEKFRELLLTNDSIE